jgi:predicted amidohydrolase YtcJ
MKAIRNVSLLAVLTVSLTALSIGQLSAQSPTVVKLIKAGRLLDPRTGHVLSPAAVLALDIIRAVTTNAADMLGWQDRVGAIEPGKFADLVADGQVVRNDLASH